MSDAGPDFDEEAMRKEEEKLRKQSERDAEKTKEREQQKWQKKSEDTGYLKDLDWFLSRSQVKNSESPSSCRLTNFTGILVDCHEPIEESFGGAQCTDYRSTQIGFGGQNAELSIRGTHVADVSVSNWA